jgi:hypothetical protein
MVPFRLAWLIFYILSLPGYEDGLATGDTRRDSGSLFPAVFRFMMNEAKGRAARRSQGRLSILAAAEWHSSFRLFGLGTVTLPERTERCASSWNCQLAKSNLTPLQPDMSGLKIWVRAGVM